MHQWYVNAITGRKEIMILMDAADDIPPPSKALIKKTVHTILETLGPNDFVNIMTLSEPTSFAVPCFSENLVQATHRNKRKLMQGLEMLTHPAAENVSVALNTAFQIVLKDHSDHKNCDVALMIVTDKMYDKYNEVISVYNTPHVMVRMFTYLINGGRSDQELMKQIACENKGYYQLITNSKRIEEQVYKYIKVMSVPMALYKEDKVWLNWSPSYKIGKELEYAQNDKTKKPVLTLSRAVFDYRNNSERTAEVLGVAALEFSVDEFKKVIPDHKLGVGGFSFMIDQHGHLLFHPELRFETLDGLYPGAPKPVYYGIDIAEVEHWVIKKLEDQIAEVMKVRRTMSDSKLSENTITLQLHYEGMKRFTLQKYQVFYSTVKDTPFILGIALPDEYGSTVLEAEEEIKLSERNLLSYFGGTQWRVHPDWIYCRYDYPDKYNFRDPEEELIHFIVRSSSEVSWRWLSFFHAKFPRKTLALDRNTYYCNKDLLQSVIYDAIVTRNFGNISDSSLESRDSGYRHFGETTTFVATRSGLLRFHHHTTPGTSPTPPIFPPPPTHFQYFTEDSVRAIDEMWYKRAVQYHEIDPYGFIYSVPFNAAESLDYSMVIGTHALFLEKSGEKTPAAVVGMQFKLDNLITHFRNITATCLGKCSKTCANNDMECYVLDDHGYILVAKTVDYIGKFFGEVDGTIMDSLVKHHIYENKTIIDHQSECAEEFPIMTDAATSLLNPFQLTALALRWFINGVTLLALHLALLNQNGVFSIYRGHEDEEYDIIYGDRINIGTIDYSDETVNKYRVTNEYGQKLPGVYSSHPRVPIRHEKHHDHHHHHHHHRKTEGTEETEDFREWINKLPPNPKQKWMEAGYKKSHVGKSRTTRHMTTSTTEATWQFPYPEVTTPATTYTDEPTTPASVFPDGTESTTAGLFDGISVDDDQVPPLYVPGTDHVPQRRPLSDYGKTRRCTKTTVLYTLQSDRLQSSNHGNPLKGKLTNCNTAGCERPFSVQKVPYSNLVLLVIDTKCHCGAKPLSIKPQVVPEGDEYCAARRKDRVLSDMDKCVHYHPQEEIVKKCSSSSKTLLLKLLLFLPVLVSLYVF